MRMCVRRLRIYHKIRTIILVGLFLLLLLYSIILFQNETYFRHFEPWVCNVTERTSNRTCYSNDTKTILFFTPWFRLKPWPGIATTELYLSDYPTKKCRITYDIDDVGKSDLIIFHGADMLRYDPYDRSVRTKELEQLHKYRCPSQRMAFLTQETAMNDPLESDLSLPEGFFNWTITYRRDSDFHLPYASYVRLPSAENPPELVNYAADKNKFVLWAVSRCGRIRDKYVKKLLKYIKVDIYGGCSGTFGQDNQCPRSSNCENLFKPYKFYLAFENGVCTDYITEKFWNAIKRNSVPIVLTKDYYGPDVVPQGSFISVQDFPSVKALAEYLMYLDKNDTAYNEYFSWKQEFVYEQRSRFRYAACDICDALHNECLKPKVYHDIFKTFWNEEVDCTEREQTLLKLIDRE
ncbi:LOW QUALITY PROTEIN: glycoprotein 3-alpha-L-fucosyltransferase A-like [Oculina patagonica]